LKLFKKIVFNFSTGRQKKKFLYCSLGGGGQKRKKIIFLCTHFVGEVIFTDKKSKKSD